MIVLDARNCATWQKGSGVSGNAFLAIAKVVLARPSPKSEK